MVGNNFPKLGLVVSTPYAHRYTHVILNTSSRQGMPGSTSQGWQCRSMQQVSPQEVIVKHSHPCALGNCSLRCSTSCIHAVVDPGIPCRDDGVTQTLVYKDERRAWEP